MASWDRRSFAAPTVLQSASKAFRISCVFLLISKPVNKGPSEALLDDGGNGCVNVTKIGAPGENRCADLTTIGDDGNLGVKTDFCRFSWKMLTD
jgi:hypothetical protein